MLGSTVPTGSGQRGRSSTNQNETNILTHRPRRSTANYSLEIYARNGLGPRKMDSGNGCAVAENPAKVTRSSGQTTCDAGGDDGAMLEADKECSETEHQTDDEEVTDDDDGGGGDDDDEDETEDEDKAEEVEGKERDETEESDVSKKSAVFCHLLSRPDCHWAVYSTVESKMCNKSEHKTD